MAAPFQASRKRAEEQNARYEEGHDMGGFPKPCMEDVQVNLQSENMNHPPHGLRHVLTQAGGILSRLPGEEQAEPDPQDGGRPQGIRYDFISAHTSAFFLQYTQSAFPPSTRSCHAFAFSSKSIVRTLMPRMFALFQLPSTGTAMVSIS